MTLLHVCASTESSAPDRRCLYAEIRSGYATFSDSSPQVSPGDEMCLLGRSMPLDIKTGLWSLTHTVPDAQQCP